MEHCAGAVGDGELVVAGGDAAPLLCEGEVSLDDVATLVGHLVEAGRASTPAAAAFAGSCLVPLVRDHGLDTAPPQLGSDDAGRVGAVRDHHIRTCAWSAATGAENIDLGEDFGEHRAVRMPPPSPRIWETRPSEKLIDPPQAWIRLDVTCDVLRCVLPEVG